MSKEVKGITLAQLDKLSELLLDVKHEYIDARRKFGPFDNGHEGIGVIREEYLELEKFVFGKDQTVEQIMNARRECIQLAAMALSFHLELL